MSGGIVIDVSEMKAARLDPASRTVTVGAGFTQGEIVATLGEEGFAVPTGGEATVGLAGATLGGGLGFLTRNFGMACDNLMAAEVVVPWGDDGAEAVTAGEHNKSERFFRAESASAPGSGIGLAIVEELVRAHHGQLHIDSQPGRGTEVTITLPAG